MHQELADFLDYCRIERRLAPLTCSAYARDASTCIAFLEREGLVTVGEVGTPPAPLPCRGIDLQTGSFEPGTCGRRAQVLLRVPIRERADRS